MKVSTISAALTVLVTSAFARSIEARTVSDAKFTLSGFQDSTGAYPNYTLSIPENGIAVHITNPLVVVSIEQATEKYTCTFTGADGSVTNLGVTADVDPPQAQVSVTCK